MDGIWIMGYVVLFMVGISATCFALVLSMAALRPYGRTKALLGTVGQRKSGALAALAFAVAVAALTPCYFKWSAVRREHERERRAEAREILNMLNECAAQLERGERAGVGARLETALGRARGLRGVTEAERAALQEAVERGKKANLDLHRDIQRQIHRRYPRQKAGAQDGVR